MTIMIQKGSGLPPKKASGTPVLLGSPGISVPLARISLDKNSYNEVWLQQLAFDHPQVMPIIDIEPGFGEIYAVAREVPCAHGLIDNLYITATGDLVLVEAKLWRNPQARREVVAQALDYVAALMGMPYEAFENACRKGQGMAASSLYALISEKPDALEERVFIDAVSRNLRRGRILIIALGDGIRAEAELLAELLQSHAGAHFTFALVELAIWQNTETDDLIVLPSTLAQTVMITRGIVTVEDNQAVLQPMPVGSDTKPTSISSELYFEELAKSDPALPGLLRAFAASLEPLGVYTDQRKTLNLKVEGPDKAINLGYINTKGRLWTDVGGQAPPPEYMDYLQTLANLIGGKVVVGSYPCVLDHTGSKPLLRQLLPQHSDAWRSAITKLVEKTRTAQAEE